MGDDQIQLAQDLIDDRHAHCIVQGATQLLAAFVAEVGSGKDMSYLYLGQDEGDACRLSKETANKVVGEREQLLHSSACKLSESQAMRRDRHVDIVEFRAKVKKR